MTPFQWGGESSPTTPHPKINKNKNKKIKK
jgi:hypothetical protein